MELNLEKDVTVPVSVREGLERFCGRLSDSLGERLVSVILYGGLAKGEFAPLSSDVNVMVVVSEVTVETLDKIISPVQEGVRDFRLAVMVLSEDDLRRSVRAFPVKFLDIQQRHRMLWGQDVLTNLSIPKEHLRLRCEQEITNLLLRLHQFYLQRMHQSDLIENTLTRAVSSFLTSLGVLIRLKTGRAPSEKAAIAEAAARELGLDSKPLREVLALKAGTSKPDVAELKRLYDAFMASVHQAAQVVERL